MGCETISLGSTICTCTFTHATTREPHAESCHSNDLRLKTWESLSKLKSSCSYKCFMSRALRPLCGPISDRSSLLSHVAEVAFHQPAILGSKIAIRLCAKLRKSPERRAMRLIDGLKSLKASFCAPNKGPLTSPCELVAFANNTGHADGFTTIMTSTAGSSPKTLRSSSSHTWEAALLPRKLISRANTTSCLIRPSRQPMPRRTNS